MQRPAYPEILLDQGQGKIPARSGFPESSRRSEIERAATLSTTVLRLVLCDRLGHAVNPVRRVPGVSQELLSCFCWQTGPQDGDYLLVDGILAQISQRLDDQGRDGVLISAKVSVPGRLENERPRSHVNVLGRSMPLARLTNLAGTCVLSSSRLQACAPLGTILHRKRRAIACATASNIWAKLGVTEIAMPRDVVKPPR